MLVWTLFKGDIEGYDHLSPIKQKTKVSKPFIYNAELVSAAPVILARRKSPI